jgi:stage II sporulation protein D
MLAALVSIGILSLFEPQSLLLETAEIAVGGERIRVAAPVEVRAEGNHVVCRIGSREVRGALLTGPGPRVRIVLPKRFARTYEGRVKIAAVEGKLFPVITMDLETAVSRVVAAEMPSAAKEAQKAQAIAARSYYRSAGRTHTLFDFCDTTHCQLLQEREDRVAADATAGQVLTYQGRILRALYFRSCSGRTLQPADILWSGEGYAYQRVECAACRRDPKQWESRLPRRALPEKASEKRRLEVAREFGWDSLPSNTYTVLEDGGNGKTVLVRGLGEGHGVGMCQRGASAMGAAGGADAQTILRHYFPGAEVTR